MSAVTPWFAQDVRPVRIGDYQVRPFGGDSTYWSYWDGKRWSYFTANHHDLAARKHHCTHPANMSWRGLAADPSVSAK